MLSLRVVLVVLLLLPVTLFLAARLVAPRRAWTIAGATLGAVVFPASRLLVVGFGLFYQLHHLASRPAAWMRAPGSGSSLLQEVLVNGLVWGVVLALGGHLLDRAFGRKSDYSQFASVAEKLAGLGLEPASVWSAQGLDAYHRAMLPLDEADEMLARELSRASHGKDREKVREIGRRLDDEGGIEKMKLVCYRVRHIGGDDRWLEMVWSGIGEWMG